jgi:hypothetical protein
MKTQHINLKELSDDALEARRMDLQYGDKPKWHGVDAPALVWSLVLTGVGGIVFACGGGLAVAAVGAAALAGSTGLTVYTCKYHLARRRALRAVSEEQSERVEERVEARRKNAAGAGNGLSTVKPATPAFDDAAAPGSTPDVKAPPPAPKAPEIKGPPL